MTRFLPLALALSLAAPSVTQNTTCRVDDYGPDCGPTISGSEMPTGNLHVLTFHVQDGIPDGMGIGILGLVEARIPLVFYRCDVLTVPLVIFLFPMDSAGRATQSFSFPRQFAGSIFVQAASFTLVPNVLFTTDGLEVECRRD